MADIIHLLPDSVANQIAAGEVIQGPASVIKELVENAIDAGATEIRIVVKDAGKTLIQVIDNGKGMTPTDTRMAFERHATSKISSSSDLDSLVTMGFRGEALPSICAVAQVELRTRTAAENLGTALRISASQVESQEPCVTDAGTNIMVRNLFFNVPARRRFLKSDKVELARIMREFERLALVNENCRLTLDTGTKTIDLPAASFRNRIADMWKGSLDISHFVPVEIETSLVSISGFVSRPEYARRRNALQFLAVNGRNMRHPAFHKAIMSAFENLIARDTMPCWFLRFQVDPASIDVNVHPAKSEIKFEYEAEIWRILAATVKSALGRYSAVPSIDFTSDVLPVEPALPGEVVSIPQDEFTPSVPRQAAYHPDRPRQSSMAPNSWERLWEPDEPVKKTEAVATLADMVSQPSECLQLSNSYIVFSRAASLLIIDQYRAHLLILYNRYLQEMAPDATWPSQAVIFPETIVLDEKQRDALVEMESRITALGFRLNYSDDDRWILSAVPAGLPSGTDPRSTLLRILDNSDDDDASLPECDLRQRLALTLARAAAIRRGTRLSAPQMEGIVAQLFSLQEPRYTPSGLPVFRELSIQEIGSMFNR